MPVEVTKEPIVPLPRKLSGVLGVNQVETTIISTGGNPVHRSLGRELTIEGWQSEGGFLH